MNQETLNTDVLIEGGGCTGLTLADGLDHDGMSVVPVVCKRSTIAAPRVLSIGNKSLRTMQAVGLGAAVMCDAAPVSAVQYLLGRGGVAPAESNRHPATMAAPRRNAFRQAFFDGTARAGLGRFTNVRPLLSHELRSLSKGEDSVTTTVGPQRGTYLNLHACFGA